MLGNLTLSAIPWDDPIVMGAVSGSLVLGAAIIGLITWQGRWSYLWNEWLTSLDHKRIGVMYLVLSLVMLLRGLSDAVMMRAQQALAVGASGGFLPPSHFDQIFTAHGTIMIVFMAMPFIAGLMNIVVPQQIGARDVAFPFLNSLSLWLTVAGAMLVMVSLGVGEFSKAGWSGYSPLTEKLYSPGTGVDYWTWAFQIAGVASLLSGINFFVTILRMRAPGMHLMRMPLFAWTVLFTTILMICSFPVLTVALGMLSLDRYLGMHFFSNTAGGNMMTYVNLFWMWGHPEVYIVALPAFGIFSEVVATFSGKRLFGYKSLVYATGSITILSFGVWLHHFFTMGSSPDVNTFFGLTTMLIAVPTGVKIFNWLFTMYRGRVRLTVPMLWTLGFITSFTLGGAAGVLMGEPPADYVVHNSLFLVAHFHTMLITGTFFGLVAGYTYWFPKMTGFCLNEKWGKRAFFFWLVGFYLAFGPLYVLGLMGMPRRMWHYGNPAWRPWLVVAAGGTALIVIGTFLLLVQLFVSFREREKGLDSTGDPYDGRTLEWSVSSPPPVYNFARIPVVRDIDAFTDMKEKGLACSRPARYHDIEIPKNSGAGFIIGVLSFLLGFGLIWYIWWLAASSAAAIILIVIGRSFDEHTHRIITAAEIERIEKERFRRLEMAR